MSKASLIREIMALGYTGRSPNTLRRWSVERLQGLLSSLAAPPVSSVGPALEPHIVSEDMAAYVDAQPVVPVQAYIPTDRELYIAALPATVPTVPVPAPFDYVPVAIAVVWTMLAVAGFAAPFMF